MAGAERRAIDVGALAALDVRGRAVLLHTGDDARFGTPGYAEGAHFLTRAGAAWLAASGAALVGIDAINIDDIEDGSRPAHTLLLAAGIPVVEHLTGLGQLPPTGRPVHRRAAAHRGIRHHPGARVRPAAGVICPRLRSPVGFWAAAVIVFRWGRSFGLLVVIVFRRGHPAT